MVALCACGEVMLRGAAVAAADGPLVDEPRRRRLSPVLGRPPCAAAWSSLWSSSPSSSLMLGPPLMERPPGMLALGGGPGMFMALPPDERPRGGPTGMEEGRVPWGALRHAWIRFLPSGWVTRGWSFAVVKVYTRPVSETTRRRTCVPVRVESSYALGGCVRNGQ